eukprot:5073865-Prymnesium_polylepis.1
MQAGRSVEVRPHAPPHSGRPHPHCAGGDERIRPERANGLCLRGRVAACGLHRPRQRGPHP